PSPTNTPRPTFTPEPTLPPQPTSTPLALGQPASFADWDYAVTDVFVMDTVGEQVARGMYIIALVQVTNNAATERELGQFFVAKDSRGRLYEMDTETSLEYHHAFDTATWYLEDIAPAASGVIPVAFDVSPDAAGVILLAAGTNEPAIFLAEDLGGEKPVLPGEPVLEAADWSFIVTEAKTTTSIGDATPRGQYVVIIIKARNDGLTPREIDSFFTLKDAQGRLYEMDTDASLEYHHTFDTDAWHLEALGPSLIGTIPIVFDVSPDATQLRLQTNQGSLETPPLLDAVGGEPIQLSGEVYRNDNWEFVIKETSNATSIGDEISEGQFLIVLLQIKNLGLSQQSLEQLFKLKDAQGRFYEMDTDASLEYH
ncbi:MAG: DUF4352 domain-containing protein, partial [Gammaproteobacteria bacterium]|nr:DUF4352 domain-containing protein [Gammaproteobacteria bacterium]